MRRIAFLVFPRLTLLDFVGVYDVLRRAPGALPRVVGTAPEVTDESGVTLRTDGVYEDLKPFDLLVVPGGFGTRPLLEDDGCIDYLASWGTVRPLASVCTGALLIGKAGHLAGKRATTHHNSFDLLAPFCREVVKDVRVVDEGRVVTAAGVTSAIDLGLHLVAKHWDAATRARIAEQIEYRG